MNQPLPQTFHTFFAKYGANIAGSIWMAGSLVQFLIGTVTTSPLEIISSVFNIASPLAYSFFGRWNWGVVVGASLGIIGTELAVHPGLIAGESGTIFGFTAFVIASAAGGIFSRSLTIKFSVAKNSILRSTVGNPRRLMGLMIFTLARLPIIYTGLAHGRGFAYVAPFIIWGMGDLAYSLSRADVEDKNS